MTQAEKNRLQTIEADLDISSEGDEMDMCEWASHYGRELLSLANSHSAKIQELEAELLATRRQREEEQEKIGKLETWLTEYLKNDEDFTKGKILSETFVGANRRLKDEANQLLAEKEAK